MFAIIETGGKQYRVEQGSRLLVEKLNGEAGSAVTFDRVLCVSNGEDAKVGTPYLDNVSVDARVVEQTRGKKIRITKFKRRKHYMRRSGHRQYLTDLEVTAINQ